MRARWPVVALLVLLALWLSACAPTATPGGGTPVRETVVVVVTEPGSSSTVIVTASAEGPTGVPATSGAQPTTPPQEPTRPPDATSPPGTTATVPASPTFTPPATTLPEATATVLVEARVVEVEWPPQLRLGDSATVRLALVPGGDGYVLTAEFPESTVLTRSVPLPHPSGYDLAAVGRLDALGFDLLPQAEQARVLVPGETTTWHWTLTPRASGQHTLLLTLTLRWTPQPGNRGPSREAVVYSKGLKVAVGSLMGLTTREATMLGMFGLVLGVGLSIPLAVHLAARRTAPLRAPRSAPATVDALDMPTPNAALMLECPPGVTLSASEESLLRALFARYARLTLEAEFRSGYSGARTFLALPLHADGRADAFTIAKLGDRAAIQQEHRNFDAFVKDTLPPITARIQHPPVGVPGGTLAALRYTFIGEPGRPPTSLREALLTSPDPVLLERLFDTFGPNWWLQRKPFTFRLGQQYDRMLTTHLVVEPVSGEGALLDGRVAPGALHSAIGDLVTLRHFTTVERRVSGSPANGHSPSFSIAGTPPPGHPPLRVRWLAPAPPDDGATGRVVATRQSLLEGWTAGFDLRGLPDPLARLAALLDERVMGSQSIIHGDLNLENVLVGPGGGLMWLIDFAQTREGHPLADFAHLQAEVIAHVLAARVRSGDEYLALLERGDDPLLVALDTMAGRCLFDPAQDREYRLALYAACLGALKFANLGLFSRELLFLTAAFLVRGL